jgi:hypothetical protein
MASGNFFSAGYMADEASYTMETFFDSETYANKIEAAFEFPNRVPPGKEWVYHTSDTIILTQAMNSYLIREQGEEADIFNFVRDEIYAPLHLSAGTFTTLRTDNLLTGAPFGGYSLFLTRDDISKIALLLNNHGGIIGNEQVLNPEMLADAMQTNPQNRGLDTTGFPVFKYQNSLWAKQWDSFDSPEISCKFWTPFMTG